MTDMSQTLKEIRRLASQIVALQKQMREMGLFPGDRELLECHNCGLLEDVTSSGLLITYKPKAEGQDTGLRFKELSGNRFRCPVCGSIVREADSR
jgi:hypothetical protein